MQSHIGGVVEDPAHNDRRTHRKVISLRTDTLGTILGDLVVEVRSRSFADWPSLIFVVARRSLFGNLSTSPARTFGQLSTCAVGVRLSAPTSN